MISAHMANMFWKPLGNVLKIPYKTALVAGFLSFTHPPSHKYGQHLCAILRG